MKRNSKKKLKSTSESALSEQVNEEELVAGVKTEERVCPAEHVLVKNKSMVTSKQKSEFALCEQVGEEERIADVKTADGQFCFSDGVGRMSLAVSAKVANRLRRLGRYKRPLPPSAVQIRYRGCKGMLTLDPRLQGIK